MKITLYPMPNSENFRAVVGRSGRGWAYPIRRYKDGETEILEAMVDPLGVVGTATFRFTLQGDNWTADSDKPISKTHDHKAGRSDL